MKITFLGTGTSTGVPMVGCSCGVCGSVSPFNKRLRSSIFIEIDDKKILIDTTPDLRYQFLREGIKNVDAILVTHSHKDHLSGLDDIRAINHFQKKIIPVYTNKETIEAIHRDFYYAFLDDKYPGIFDIKLFCIEESAFVFENIVIQPIEVQHAQMKVLGFRINDFTYITDANYISANSLEKIKGTKVLVLNALRKTKHLSHFTLQEAIEISKKLDISQTYLTHISHQMGLHEEVEKELPLNVCLAYDGLSINV